MTHPRCLVNGCLEPRFARDLCTSHYEKIRRDAAAIRAGRQVRIRTPEEIEAFAQVAEPETRPGPGRPRTRLVPTESVEVVGASPPGTSTIVLAPDDLAAVTALVDVDARAIAILLWNHIGRASFAGLEPFTLEKKRRVTP